MSAHFRLAVVLRLRELAEDAARARLGVALRDHRAAADDLTRLRAMAAAETARLAELQQSSARAGGSPAHELVDAADAIGRAERSIATGQLRLATAADALMTARLQLADAAKRREVVERLRDRFLARERQRLDRREEATLNEIASTRHAWAVIEEQGQ